VSEAADDWEVKGGSPIFQPTQGRGIKNFGLTPGFLVEDFAGQVLILRKRLVESDQFESGCHSECSQIGVVPDLR
jgi:hypothetical protein